MQRQIWMALSAFLPLNNKSEENMDTIKGVVFDIDGTITSTNKLIYDSFNHIYKKYKNKILTPEEIRSLFGPTEEVIIRELFNHNSDEVIEEYFRFYSENHHLAALYPDIEKTLQTIRSAGLPMGIYTGKGRRSSMITLEKLGVKHYFDFIVTGDEVKEHKPSPEGIELFLERFGLPPAEVLFLGDAVVDIMAARASGVYIGSVVWDSYAKEEVIKSNPDFLFAETGALFEFIAKRLNN